MPNFDSKFLKNLPTSKYYSNDEILLTSNKINWKNGNLFRRDLNPTAGQITKFKFSNVENFREIILTIVNNSTTEQAEVYLPLGFWTDGEPVSIIPPMQRMVVRITSTEGAIYYEASNDLLLYAYPTSNPIAIEQVPAVNTSIGDGLVRMTQEQSDPDIGYVGVEYDARIGAIVQQNAMTFDIDGTYNPEISSKLSDVMIRAFCFNEDMSIAYVWGLFGSYYNTNPTDAPTYADSNPRLLAVDMETGEADGVFQFNNPTDLGDTRYMINEGSKVYMRGNSKIGCIDVETGTLDWMFQISLPYQFSIVNPTRLKIKVVGNYIYCLTRGYDNVNFNKDVVIRINKTTGAIDSSYHTPALALSLPDGEFPCWDVNADGLSIKFYEAVYNSGTTHYDSKLLVNDNGAVQLYILSEDINFLACELTDTGIRTIQRTMLGGSLTKVTTRTMVGAYVSDLFSLGAVNSFALLSMFQTFQEKIYIMIDGILSRYSLSGAFDSTFNPLSFGATNSTGVLSMDVIFTEFSFSVMSKQGDAFTTVSPMATQGSPLLTRKVGKIKISTRELLGTVSHDAIQGTDDQDMIQIPTVPDRLFVKNNSGYKVINTVTMTEDLTWGFNVQNAGVEARVYADGYIYMMSNSANADVYNKAGTLLFNDVPKGSMWRLDVSTKDIDPLFLITTYSDADNNNGPAHLENTTNYLYITYRRGFGVGSLIQVKKSDWTSLVVSSVTSFSAQTKVRVHELDSGLALLVAPAKNAPSSGINGCSFVVIDESDLSVVAFAGFNDTFETYQYDGEGNVYYITHNDLKLKKCDLFTMNTQVKLTLKNDSVYGARDSIQQILGEKMDVQDGFVYFSAFGYYNRQLISGIVKYNPLTNKLEA